MSNHPTSNQKLARNSYNRYDRFFIFKQFLSHVAVGAPNECWEWQGSRSNYEHGKFYSLKSTEWAHVAAYRLFVGKIPKRKGKNKLYVCHKCDNPPCVNPAHLFLGTQQQNMFDCVSKGRNIKSGTKYTNSKYLDASRTINPGSKTLSTRDIRKIIDIYSSGTCSQVKLAKKFNVTQGMISSIVRKSIKDGVWIN